MPKPNPELEQLLSGYLDGAVSQEERARVEQWLADDSAAAADFEQMEQLSERLREADTTKHQLPEGFADRVIESAIDRARLEGCDDSHPLLRAATQPASRVVLPSRWLAAAGVAVAVAASLLLAIIFIPTEDGQQSIAQNDPTAPIEALADLPSSDSVDPTSIVEPNDLEPAQSVDQSTVTSDPATTIAMQPASDRRTEPEAVDVSPQVTPGATPEPSSETVDSLAAVSRNDDLDIDGSKLGKGDIPKTVLVLDIRLVDSRLGLNPIREAMQKARVDDGSEQLLDQAIVGAIASAVDDPTASGSLMYLRAPAKQLDRFILNLLDDQRQVSSVGLSLADDAPVLNIAGQFAKVDATTVRHDFASLIGAQRSSRLGSQLLDRLFIPLRGSDAAGTFAAMVGSPESEADNDGPDILSDVFLLVR